MEHGVGQKPNFCHNCGQSLGGSAAAQVEKISADYDEEEDSGQIVKLPNIQGLEVEIEPDRVVGVTFGQVFQQASVDDSRPSADVRRPRVAKKKILDQIKRESSTLRPRGKSVE
jgi:hypothetical protein